ncbi:hypothetical protein SEA_SPOOKY_90 [Gordonia phage Spooky]|nr:hypothetical protein SEA_SPOOKY_90 [Gordonia phage Spooky]
MPRKRMLWPNYFSSDQLAQLSLAACRTFEGFWCFADDRGRMLYDPEQIWGEVWLKRRKVDHVTIEDVETHLDDLVSNGQLCQYHVGGARFLHVISWDEHQSINHPTPSKLPPCERHQGKEWAKWWMADDTATDRWRQAEKAAKSERINATTGGLREDYGSVGAESQIGSLPADMNSGSATGQLREDSRKTPSQSSSVQSSSVQAMGGGEVRQFVRPSQRGIS